MTGPTTTEWTPEAVCNVFFDLEDRHALLDWTIQGVHPWALQRFELYFQVMQSLGIFERAHKVLPNQQSSPHRLSRPFELSPVKQPGFVETLGSLFRWKSTPAGEDSAKRVDALLMTPRRVDGLDLYSFTLRKELADDAVLIDWSSNDEFEEGAYCAIQLIDQFGSRPGTKPQKKLRGSASRENERICHTIRTELSQALSIEIEDFSKKLSRQIARFRSLREGAEQFFRMHNIGTFYLTNSYSKTSQTLIDGARSAGARVVELQHGVMSRYHLGYSWPGQTLVPYMPDELWCFGDFWPQTTPLPQSIATRTIGAPFIDVLSRKNSVSSDPNLVVFSSQGVIGERLFDLCIETARRRADLRFLFRLHPNESFEDYQAKMQSVKELPSNIELSHRDPNIFSLMKQAAIIVGVFSTTLFEAMALGSRVMVVDMPGVEYMRPSIERGDALLVRTVDELVQGLDHAPLAQDPNIYYAPSVEPLLTERCGTKC